MREGIVLIGWFEVILHLNVNCTYDQKRALFQINN